MSFPITRTDQMERKKKIKLAVFLLTGLLASIACNISDPISGFGRAIEKMFEGIAHSINF